uniref:Adhesion G-protein coupled receptor G4 n=1 Tax=Saimiri boliviensis boliviensis TaxID=39432 RepID=A0A2K6SK51_SAIBB|nr:adhesion G-protein coupled receptor G4 isoform X1 [Saimiri boliviensis boliviensis]
MKERIIYQRLYGLILMSSFIFLSDTLSLKGKKLDFLGRSDTYVSLIDTIPELSRFTACIDLVFMDDNPSYWMAFSYITNKTLLGREDIDFGLAGDHQRLILYKLGKTFYIRHPLASFQWHTICLIWDGVKGKLELFLNKERILVVMDQPHNLTPHGTLFLGYFLRNGSSEVKSVMPSFPGSLYYFQLWDHILENEEFMKCLDGNVVSWEEDVWLVNKIIPTVDRTLRCFVPENTIQERSTTLSQQIDMTTPPQITGLNPQNTAHSSTVLSQSIPIFATDYTTITYSSTTSPPLETMTAQKILKTLVAETATFAIDVLSTSAAISMPNQSISIDTTTSSMKNTKSPSSENTKTTKMAEAMATEIFQPTTPSNFLSTSRFTKNSIASTTSAIKSQWAVRKTTSLFPTIESTSMSTASCLKQKSTNIGALSISTAGQEFTESTAAETVPWLTVEKTSSAATHIGTVSAFPDESVLISTAAPVDSISPKNRTSSPLATTDKKIAFTAHSLTLPTRLIETTPAPRTAETELTSTNFQDVSLPRVEDGMSTSMSRETSSKTLSFLTSFSFTGTENAQTVIDAEATHTALTPEITLVPTVAETMLSSTVTGPVYTQNTPTADEHMLTLISTRSASASKAPGSVPTSTTDKDAHLFFTNETIWTSRPDHTLLTSMNTTTILTFVPNENFTSAFHESTTHEEHLSTTTNIITPLKASPESKGATTTAATAARYATALSKLTFMTSLPEFKLTTLLLKTIPISTNPANELPSISRETVVPSVDTISTLAYIQPNFSTEESASETTQAEVSDAIVFGDTTTPVRRSATTQSFNATVTRKEATSHYLMGKSTIAAVAEVSPFSTMLEVTDESAQMVTASVTVSSSPDIEKLTTPLDNKTAPTEVRESWLSTKLVKTTPRSSYNETTEMFNSNHTYVAQWTSETSEGISAGSPTSGSTHIFSEFLGASTTRISETSFPTIPTDRTVTSLSDDILPPQPTAAHSSETHMPVTHMFSLPVNGSSVVSQETEVTMSEPSTLARAVSTSMRSDVSNLSSATMTTALVPPLDQTASTTSDIVPSHRDSIHTTSKAAVISVRKTSMAVPSLTETSFPSLSLSTPVIAKTETTLSSTSVDTVTPSTHTLLCSKPPDSIPTASSTPVISTMSTLEVTQPISQVEETSTYALSFPYTFSGGGDVARLTTGTTETSDEAMPSHTYANKLTTSVDSHISQSATYRVHTPMSQLVTSTSILSSDKDQMTISLGKNPRTVEMTEMSSSNKSFISYSPDTPSLDTGFSETTKISSHQTHLPSEIPLGTSSDGNSALSPISVSTQIIPTLTSSNTVDVHIPEMSTSLGKTALPSQALTTTTLLSPEKESMSALSAYTPRTVEMMANSTYMTHSISYGQDTSFVDTTTFSSARISDAIDINTTFSHLPSLSTQPEVTSVASFISESTQTFPESLSLSTTGLYNDSFTFLSDRITAAFSVPNVPTTLHKKASMATSTPIYQMSSLPVNVTAFTSTKVSDTSAILITKSSKTMHPGCLKSPCTATSGPMSEMSLMPVNNSAFAPATVSFDTSTTVGSFSTLLSSVTPMITMTMQTLDVTPVTYAGPSKNKRASAFTTEMIEVPSRITPTTFFSPTEPTLPPVKTVPITIMAGIVTPLVGTTAFSLLSSKNTEAISSIPKTTFSPFLSAIQQSSQADEATTFEILSGITDSSQSMVNSGTGVALTNTYSRTTVPENMLSPTHADTVHTSFDIQVSPSLTNFKSTFGPTKSVKTTAIYLSSNTGKMTSLSEKTSLINHATSLNTPVSFPPWTPSSTTPPSLTSFLYSPHSTEAELSTPKTSPPPTSQMVEFPVLGTRITSSNTQSLLMTSWNMPIAEGSQFPISTTIHVPTSNQMETDTLHLVPGTLSTFTASQTGLVSKDVMAMSSIPTSGILPTYGLSENPSLSTSLRAIPTTLADIKHTFEKMTTSVTPGTTLPSNLSGATSGSVISKATTLPILTWLLSSLPSGSPSATESNVPHVMTSSTVEMSKSTFLTSDMLSVQPFTKLTTLSPATISTILTQTTPTSTLDGITTGFPTSFPMSIKVTDGIVYISTHPEASSRTTVTANHRTVPHPSSFSGKSMSPSTTDHTVFAGSMPLPSSTITSSWSRIPAASSLSTLIIPKPTLDSFLNIMSTTSTVPGASFPLISTGVTHPSTATMSSPILSSFETTRLDATPSFLSTEASTSPIATKSTVSFYNIEMSFSVFVEEPRILITSVINEFTENWLNSIFQDSEFSLANLKTQIKSRDISEEEMVMDRAILEQREGQGMATISYVPYSCVCQVIIKASSSLASSELISKIKSKIHGNFTHGNFTQDQLILLVNSEHVAVKKLEPGNCKADETVSKYKGTYKWLLTNPTETAQTRCIKNEDGNATRICLISINTGKSQWEKPKFKQCKLLQELPDKIVDLANITISDENAEDVAEHILNLINESPSLDKEETKIIVSKVSDISQCDEISMNLTDVILQIINVVLEKQNDSASDLHEVSNEILRIIEHAGHKMEFSGQRANLTVAGLALAVLRMDHTFDGMAFSIHSYEEGTDPEIFLGNVPVGRILASIYLPKSLMERIPISNLQTILFNFFGQTSLFKIKNVTKALTTYVVSASISDMSVQSLADPVVITLQHIEGNQNYGQVHCAFWDFENNNGLGGWNSSGCKVKETNVNYTICQCDHLTHFGVLMDLSRSTVDTVNEQILALITYIGCGISSIFLGVALVTYIAFHKLRKDYPAKILINLCTALLMLNLVFLVNSWLSSFQKAGVCITAAVALHYFLLVSLTWMGLEAVHMYFALVKVFNIYIPNYILKFCLVGWGIPAIMVAIIVSVNKDLYGTLSSTTPLCWIKDDSIFYISVVAYFCLIFLMNLSMFCTVLAQLNSVKSQSQKTRRKMILHDLKGTTSLTFLLGLTWGFAFFAWGPVRIFFLYLFAIFNTLQGFLIFVFHCVMKESVREQWQTHLCCGWLRLDDSSDGSSRGRINIGYKQEGLKKTFEHKLLIPSLKSTATSSTFKSLGSLQGTPSEISFPNDDFDKDTYCSSP